MKKLFCAVCALLLLLGYVLLVCAADRRLAALF